MKNKLAQLPKILPDPLSVILSYWVFNKFHRIERGPKAGGVAYRGDQSRPHCYSLVCSQISEIRCERVPEMVFFSKLGVLMAVSCSWPVSVSLIHNIFAAAESEIVFRHDIYMHKASFLTFETRLEMIAHSSVKCRQVSSNLACNLFSSAYIKTLKPLILTNSF